MTSADTETEDATEQATDEARQSLLEAMTSELGDALVGSHLMPGTDLWIRVDNAAWSDTADYLRNRQRFRFFDWLSAIDWMPSPYGRSLDSEIGDAEAPDDDADDADAAVMEQGVTGGDTRFQVIARVHNLSTDLGVTIKADVGDDLTIGTWTGQYPGADWHEREAWEMFGITFSGHPGLRNLYLPTGFEGHPLRKDFPLLTRMVKPWPGIVDVEPMPETEDAE
ncbi:MAG: NADH-quinone oxidoreductase subunit C [Actinomycetota bacterium]